MNKPKIAIFTAMIILLLSILACSGSVSTANIPDAWLSTDEAGSNRTTVFSQDAVFYAQVQLKNAPDDTTLKAVWTAVNADGVDPNYLIMETEYTGGDELVHFTLSNDNFWPTGDYKVEIYLNDKLDKTLTFTVE